MRRCVLLIVFFCVGCDTLFPEFAGSAPSADLAGTDAGSDSPQISGSLCVLEDARDIRTCATGVPSGMRVTVEETRDEAPVDATGTFTLPLSSVLTSATLAAVDPSGSFAPTITTVALLNGRAIGLAVPVVRANLLQAIAQQNAVALDSTRGVILAWIDNPQGVPQQNVVVQAPPGVAGPFYDGADPNQVLTAPATGPRGLVALFNVVPGTANLLAGSTGFSLPVRPNAVTLSVLVIASP
jgi:hypothetical protein